jgi:hypothetical protein
MAAPAGGVTRIGCAPLRSCRRVRPPSVQESWSSRRRSVTARASARRSRGRAHRAPRASGQSAQAPSPGGRPACASQSIQRRSGARERPPAAATCSVRIASCVVWARAARRLAHVGQQPGALLHGARLDVSLTMDCRAIIVRGDSRRLEEGRRGRARRPACSTLPPRHPGTRGWAAPPPQPGALHPPRRSAEWRT